MTSTRQSRTCSGKYNIVTRGVLTVIACACNLAIIQLKAPFEGSTAALVFSSTVFASASSWRLLGDSLAYSGRLSPHMFLQRRPKGPERSPRSPEWRPESSKSDCNTKLYLQRCLKGPKSGYRANCWLPVGFHLGYLRTNAICVFVILFGLF